MNPDTLRIEEAKLPVKQRVILIASISVLLLFVSYGMRVVYDNHAKSPRLVFYENINDQLRKDYVLLKSDLKKDEQMLSQLQRKDDRLYRSIFGMDPLPSSIREAGTGGAVMYSSLQTINNPDDVIDVFDEIDKVLTKARIQSNSFEDLEEAAINNQQLLASKPLLQPISPADRYWLTSSFGNRSDPFTKKQRTHDGVDMAGPVGMNIYATGDGKIKFAEYNKHGYGREVLIDHGFGYTSRYAHLNEILVKSGDNVKRGQVIGTLGSTGRSTGPHLHYEVRYFGTAINPLFCFYEDLSAHEFEVISRRALFN